MSARIWEGLLILIEAKISRTCGIGSDDTDCIADTEGNFIARSLNLVEKLAHLSKNLVDVVFLAVGLNKKLILIAFKIKLYSIIEFTAQESIVLSSKAVFRVFRVIAEIFLYVAGLLVVAYRIIAIPETEKTGFTHTHDAFVKVAVKK